MMGYLVMNIGCVFSLVIAANFSLSILILLCCAPSVAFLVISIVLPESPVWLMKKGRNNIWNQCLFCNDNIFYLELIY